MDWIENKSILTPTGGFLGKGFTHTLNPFVGCAFAGSVCGVYCYAQHINWITKGRKWALYGAKKNTSDLYIKEYGRIKLPRVGAPKPLHIYMSSATDPYPPQERRWCITRGLLEAMISFPPDVLVLQTRSTLVERDIDVIKTLSKKSKVWVSITIESDLENIKGFPRQAFSPSERMATLAMFKCRDIQTQAAVAPLLPISNLPRFASDLSKSCDRVIIDHYLIGDGSKDGFRTKKTDFVSLLVQNGYKEWTSIDKLWEVQAFMKSVMGDGRVLISSDGFNSI